MLHHGVQTFSARLAAPLITDSTRANIVLVSVGVLVLAGLLGVIVHRFIMQNRAATAAETSMTRPVLAVLLVGTVLILATASLTFDDADTRNLLVGGVVSLSSAAVAFYFASSGATDARRDLLTVTSSTTQVPKLVGKTLQEVQAIMSGAHLALILPQATPAAGAVVTAQDPDAGTLVKGSHTVSVEF
jgi:PASTA domain